MTVLTELSEDGIVDNDSCHFGVLTRKCSICIKLLMPPQPPWEENTRVKYGSENLRGHVDSGQARKETLGKMSQEKSNQKTYNAKNFIARPVY